MLLPSLEEVQQALGDRYEVIDLAGAGGMGAVFRARHRTLGHVVAVKILPPEVATSAMRQARFKREAALAAHLTHPNIVPVFEFDAREGMAFLIMPFVRGRPLDEVLRTRRPLPLAEVRRLLIQVGQALQFAHLRGVVHRDVKPSNILVEEETGRVLITDFGIAHVQRSDGDNLTAPGAPIGTPDYMAPEQREGLEEVDGRADLYSLALVAFEALTGTRPGPGADRHSLARTLWASHPEVSARLAAALVAPLATRPTERPASAAAWLEHIERSAGRRWPLLAAAAGAGALTVAVAAWLLVFRGAQPSGPKTIAVMPFTVSGNPPYDVTQLPEQFIYRFSPVPGLGEAISFGRVRNQTGIHPVSNSDAEAVARDLGADYYVQASIEYTGSNLVKLTARLYEVRRRQERETAEETGSGDTLSAVMDRAWAKLLGGTFAPNPYVTIPHGKEATAAYLSAEEAFRRGDYQGARAGYDRVIAEDSSFAIAYFRRALVAAQVDPTEAGFGAALRGARRHYQGLSPADSLLLDGFDQLLRRGDGEAALRSFTQATVESPDYPQTWFVLGEFRYHFSNLFGQDIREATRDFNRVLDLDPTFIPAVAHLIPLMYAEGDKAEMQRLIQEYLRADSTSVVAEAVGIADTLVFRSTAAQLRLLKEVGRHRFLAIEYLAFQVAEVGTRDDREGPGRRILQALEERAATDEERVIALRMRVAADLRAGWVDSARARLDRATGPWAARERDLWVVAAQATGLPSLGDWRAAAARLNARLRAGWPEDETAYWLLARVGVEARRHAAALRRLASVDSAPLAVSLALDLKAQDSLAAGDTKGALILWDQAVRRYEVLRVPLDLLASLWPLRLDLARVALARGDTARAERACASFSTLIGYVDQVAEPQIERVCAPWRAPPAGP